MINLVLGINRVTEGEFKIKDYDIPSGTKIQVIMNKSLLLVSQSKFRISFCKYLWFFLKLSTYVSSRCEEFFSDPLKFKPERWLEKANSERLKKLLF